MLTKEKLIEFKRQCISGETGVEGGYVFDPADLGGETNHGITVKVANRYKASLNKSFGWSGDMKELSEEMAFWIYEQEFWKPMLLDTVCLQYSKSLAHCLFRWGLKSGSKRPVSHLQRLLNVLNNQSKLYANITPDGFMGKQTFGAIDGLVTARGHEDAVSMLSWGLSSLQFYWMFHISEERGNEVNERFTWGWMVRCMREQFGDLAEDGIPTI